MEKEQILHSIPSLQINIIREDLIEENFLRNIHFHKEIELVHVKHGKIHCIIGDRQIDLTEGKTLFINSRVFHRLCYCDVEGELTYIQIDIDKYLGQLFPEFYEYMYLFALTNSTKQYQLFDDTSYMTTLFHQIEEEGTHGEIYSNVALKAYIYLLITNMLRNNMILHPELFKSSKSFTKIASAIDYVEHNFSSKILLEDISSLANMDKYNFCKLFKQITGLTFIEYLNFRRLLHAEELLLHSDKNITEIALESGFMSIQYFNKVFKKNLNCLPSTYRKAYAEIIYG